MSLLERTVDIVRQWGPERSDDREQCIALLGRVADNLESATRVWEEVQKEAPQAKNAFTTLLAIGSERSKALYQLYMDEKEVGNELTRLTGVTFRDGLGIMEEIDVVQAYGQLRQDETVASRAEAAIKTMKERQEKVQSAVSRLR